MVTTKCPVKWEHRMDQDVEEFCTSSQLIHSVLTQFLGATTNRQQELLDQCREVLKNVVLLEAFLPPSQDLVEEFRS